MKTDFFVQKIADGLILSVDWRGIAEMLGEEEGRERQCGLYQNENPFPTMSKETAMFSEGEIMDILRKACVRWMREEYENGNPLYPAVTRFFSAVEPKTGQWLRIPT